MGHTNKETLMPLTTFDRVPRRRWLAATTTLLAALAVTPAWAQAGKEAEWPARPLRMLVGFPAGASPDLMARTIAEPLSQGLGKALVVENRPGAGGSFAADRVDRWRDNHTIGPVINRYLTI